MRLSVVRLALLTLNGTGKAAAIVDKRTEFNVHAGMDVGGRYGDVFDEWGEVTTHHKRIASIKLIGCGAGDHVIAMEVGFRDNYAADQTIRDVLHHGGHDKLAEQTLPLKQDEFVTQMVVTTWMKKVRPKIGPIKAKYQAKYHERIGSIEFTTNKGGKIKCGASLPGDIKATVTADKPGDALLYFSGRHGDNIDLLTTHWIPKEDF